MEIYELEEKAKEVRRWIIKMLAEAGSGHPGGSLSCVDLITCLYFKVMRHDPKNPKWQDRDRFILSKGHGAPALYACLALTGYFEVERLMTLRKLDSILQGHPDMSFTPGVEMSTGSLGQGLSVATGMAISGKLDKKDYRVYVVLGDGEIQEGQIWEAGMAASHYRLDNLTAFMDYNRFQIDGLIENVIGIEPVVDKWKSFGWEVLEIDGHRIREILDAIDTAKRVKGRPTMIIAHTVKGKGVSFMEGENRFHGVAPTKEERDRALQELT
ncbi:MAG: transketolase [bacterium]|nr:transketolase [bacterium]